MQAGTHKKDVFSDREKVTQAEVITMSCGRVGISWSPMDVGSGITHALGLERWSRKMLLKVVGKSLAVKSRSAVRPQPLSATVGVQVSAPGQQVRTENCTDRGCGGVVWLGEAVPREPRLVGGLTERASGGCQVLCISLTL